MGERMDISSSSRLALRLKRLGFILFVIAAVWWFVGQRVIVSITSLDMVFAGFWVVLISGTVVVAGVVVYCLGRYTFDS